MLFLGGELVQGRGDAFVVVLVGCISWVHGFYVGHLAPVGTLGLLARKAIETKSGGHILLARCVPQLPFGSYL